MACLTDKTWWFCLALLVAFAACRTAGTTSGSRRPGEAPTVPSVLDSPVEFTGPRDASVPVGHLESIKIGLFAPTIGDKVGSAMLRGAELAVECFNSSGGLHGIPIQLVRRWDDDPWRGGSREMIRLVYEDSVWAVIGSVDGEATHVAEQVVTKAWVPLLSPVSADPTLTYIRIPWMFRLPPNDESQASVLLRDGILANAHSSVGLITSTDHDGRIFANEMVRQLEDAELNLVFHMEVPPVVTDHREVVRRTSFFDFEALVMRLSPEELSLIVETLSDAGIDVPVLIPWIPGFDPSDFNERYRGAIKHLLPFGAADNEAVQEFSDLHWEEYGVAPSPSAMFTYDAVNLVIESLRTIGESGDVPNRTSLRDAVAEATGYVGVTGPVRWDNAGGNRTEPSLAIIPGARSNSPI